MSQLREAAQQALEALEEYQAKGAPFWACDAAVAALRAALAAPYEYARANPLGGPAVVFDAIARRLQAGEDYEAVLADYGLQHIPAERAHGIGGDA